MRACVCNFHTCTHTGTLISECICGYLLVGYTIAIDVSMSDKTYIYIIL